ncbi:DUF423 domain-containing protein [Shewanella sp. Isolate11]|uniref:DUF423 domain-containing protein n=1 Tax=Shewanella sp. Isolate11 TaxID=2908530 RepID=UPI001EFE8FDC|nr:DUF423 domain-containing protein [Shewanella sp. Isolate11]MCG9697267.1 DUF423 domain-containing protein [Shewanella sp. Isolate11]
MRKGFFLIAALSGFLAVALGAFAAHGLKSVTTPEMIAIFNLGVEYQFYHTFALIAVAFCSHWIRSRLLDWAGYLFIVGIMLFSGSLYLYALIGAKWTGPVTPMGGVCFLVGWLCIAVAMWRHRVVELN